MFQTISNFWRVGEIRRKIIFTLLMLIVFRLGTFIPVPNVNAEILDAQDRNVFGVIKYIWWWSITELLHFCDGNYALYYGINYHAIIANGCCS